MVTKTVPLSPIISLVFSTMSAFDSNRLVANISLFLLSRIEISVTVPCGCCVTVSGTYVDGTEDDPATTPTPSILVRREAVLDVERIA